MARIKDNEAARIRLEEKEQCRREFDQLRREVSGRDGGLGLSLSPLVPELI